MSSSWSTIASPTDLMRIKTASFNLSQNAGNYTLLTATGGDIYVEIASAYVKTAAGGLTSALIETNHTVAKSIVASALQAAITLDLDMTVVTAKFVLPSTKVIRGTIVGTGNAGEVVLIVKYWPITAGATLA